MSTIGNHPGGYPLHGAHSLSSGSGTQHRITPFGRVAFSGKAGEVHYLSSDGLSPGVCQYQAILVQAVGAGVQVDATLAPPDLALDPVQGNVFVADTAVAAGTIKTLAVSTASALRFTFAGSGTVYVAFT